ncbi:DUF6088 family protein [Thioalkalivibrio sp. HK1]|uniref:DUF6088 family protein n=1 Tax=Thioalkalivibrio sp. HK1 TaxID=1469245 RepID=UPI00047000C6|nr:DUF6088 family protein [Thioalkalivibrio sp. HK1]
MKRLSEQILEYAEQLPEGTPLTAKGLLRFGTRAAVDQALSRLAKRGELIRAGRGIYFLPIKGRFGTRSPLVGLAIKALSEQRGETIVPNGASAANLLGLTRQMPVRYLYLTSGRSRTLMFYEQSVELRHAPSWQLSFANRPAGKAIRALDWLGPDHAEKGLKKLKETLPSKEFEDLVSAAPRLPTWLARIITQAGLP